MMNSKNLGTRSTENRTLDRKIWALEGFKGKTVLSGCSGGYMWNFEWLESFGAKEQGSCRVWEIFRDFCGFLERLEWFRT
jgi:hypothetical protein